METAAAAAFLAIVAFLLLYSDVPKAVDAASPWMNTVVTQKEVEAIYWLENNTRVYEPVVYDIFGGETMMALSLRTPPIGGDWAVARDAVDRMNNVTKFYETTSAQEAAEIMKNLGARYAVVPSRQVHAGFGWKTVEKQKFSDPTFFEKAFDNGEAMVVRVK
ncbi:hypothetical protein H0O03_03030 [Candidatus Micrarchaeota archaeon]|nr:hypothetical protein [Candidatus Micrarchaeota archaeon]